MPREQDEQFHQLLPQEQAMLDDLNRKGALLEFDMSPPPAADWQGFLKLRAKHKPGVESLLAKLPLAPYLKFEITTLAKLP